MSSHPLFVSDLDGTLLSKEGCLSPVTADALRLFLQRRVPFTVASGRTFSSIRRALGQARLELPVISSDGALISSFDSPAPIHVFDMDRDAATDLISWSLSEGFSPMLDLWSESENLMVSRGCENPVMEWYHRYKLEEAFYKWSFRDDLRLKPSDALISVTFLGDREPLAKLRTLVDARYGDRFRSDMAFLEEVEGSAALWIQNKLARKENALQVLADMLGFPDQSVYVFGDELNDLGMFQGRWNAVAVANARDELKAHARHIIEAHHEDSVVRFILDRLGGDGSEPSPTN